MAHVVDIPAVIIASGDTNSAALSTVLSEGQMKVLFGNAVDILVYGPAALTGTVKVQVSPVSNPQSGDWATLQINGTDVAIVAAKANSFFAIAFRDMRFVSSGAEAADRSFIVRAVLNPNSYNT